MCHLESRLTSGYSLIFPGLSLLRSNSDPSRGTRSKTTSGQVLRTVFDRNHWLGRRLDCGATNLQRSSRILKSTRLRLQIRNSLDLTCHHADREGACRHSRRQACISTSFLPFGLRTGCIQQRRQNNKFWAGNAIKHLRSPCVSAGRGLG